MKSRSSLEAASGFLNAALLSAAALILIASMVLGGCTTTRPVTLGCVAHDAAGIAVMTIIQQPIPMECLDV